MQWLPNLIFLATLSNIVYLSLISLIWVPHISTPIVIALRICCFALTWIILRKHLPKMTSQIVRSTWLLFVPYLLILLLRFPLLYPTYDDLAVHFMWGDLANRIWQNANFMPLEFLTYFYLPYDMNYTPLLYTIGIRLTIWFFYLVTTLWLASLFQRFSSLLKNYFQNILLSVLFIMIPFIPHMMAIQGTLMLEYFTLPFILEALYQLMRKDGDKTFAVISVIAALLIKQSHSVFIAPLFLYLIWQEKKKVHWLIPTLFALWATLFFVRMYLETGNPLSGLFNGIFKSSLYGAGNFSQPLFGPHGYLETIVWPFIGQFTDRYAEGIVSMPAKIFFSPIPILAYGLSIYLMIKKRSLKYSAIALSYFIWSYLVGYARYYIALNIMTVLVLIFDLQHPHFQIPKVLLTQRSVILALITILSLSSIKTDFSWRPNPSLVTPAANEYYLHEYSSGLALVGHDTIPNIAKNYKKYFSGYDGVMPIYRGPVTFAAYMGYINGLPILESVTQQQYDSIKADPKVSLLIKHNLDTGYTLNHIIVLAENPWGDQISAFKIETEMNCKKKGYLPRDSYLQRDTYFMETAYFDCGRL